MSSTIPSPEECLDLLKKSGCSDKVIRHCKAVRDVAVRTKSLDIAKQLEM